VVDPTEISKLHLSCTILPIKMVGTQAGYTAKESKGTAIEPHSRDDSKLFSSISLLRHSL
jgi:hypothetical protein